MRYIRGRHLHSRVVHAVNDGERRSVCGVLAVDSGEGWYGSVAVKMPVVTCRRCIKKMGLSGRQDAIRDAAAIEAIARRYAGVPMFSDGNPIPSLSENLTKCARRLMEISESPCAT